MSGNNSVSTFLLILYGCRLICRLSEINLLLNRLSVSKILVLCQSKLCPVSFLCSEITDSVPVFLLISNLCSLILVLSCLFVYPMYVALQSEQDIWYTTWFFCVGSSGSLIVLINLSSLLLQ